MDQPLANSRARIPPQAFFVISSIFHYLGPSFAVLLFARLDVLGVAWLRIASAAVIFSIWRRPWRLLFRMERQQRNLLIAWGVVMGLMNASFYLAIKSLPLSTVGAIEFAGQIVIAIIGMRTRRNYLALGLAILGVALLTNIQIEGQAVGFLFAFADCALFMLYIVLGHRIAQDRNSTGVDRLGAAILIAFLVIFPLGFLEAVPAFSNPLLLLAAIGIGVCSSVIPYIIDQVVMARMSRATYALMLSLLPAIATIIGIIVLHQIPTVVEVIGIALIMTAVVVHQEPAENAESILDGQTILS